MQKDSSGCGKTARWCGFPWWKSDGTVGRGSGVWTTQWLSTVLWIEAVEMGKTLWISWCLLVVLFSGGCGSEQGREGEEVEFDSLALLAERRLKDSLFRASPESPIPPEGRGRFSGLHYYPPSREYVLPAVLEVFARQDTVELPSTKPGYRHQMVRYGVFHIGWADTVFRLVVYKPLGVYPYLLFVPFKDATTGTETYAGGRYLEIEEQPEAEEYWLDFNRAYNPYCAYNPDYACPVVPPENVLPIPIRAGEKAPREQR